MALGSSNQITSGVSSGFTLYLVLLLLFVFAKPVTCIMQLGTLNYSATSVYSALKVFLLWLPLCHAVLEVFGPIRSAFISVNLRRQNFGFSILAILGFGPVVPVACCLWPIAFLISAISVSQW
jgi:hypothetical protein